MISPGLAWRVALVGWSINCLAFHSFFSKPDYCTPPPPRLLSWGQKVLFIIGPIDDIKLVPSLDQERQVCLEDLDSSGLQVHICTYPKWETLRKSAKVSSRANTVQTPPQVDLEASPDDWHLRKASNHVLGSKTCWCHVRTPAIDVCLLMCRELQLMLHMLV